MTGVLQTLIGGFGAAAAAVTDAYFYLVTLLLPGNGTNGAQNNTFLDSSTNNFTITRNGNTTQGTFSPFSQTGWSNFFTGSGNGFLNAVSNTVFAFGTGDFTLEAFIFVPAYPSSGTAAGNIISAHNWNGSGFDFTFRIGQTGLLFFENSAGNTLTSSTAVSLNSWVHVACVRSSGTLTFYINGSSAGSGAASGSMVSTVPISIGAATSGGTFGNFTGYISNARITKGGALYTSTFTPSTTPLTTTVSSGTVSLLTCQSNRFVDNSVNAFALTAGAGASVQAFEPFAPGVAYSAATVGGSGYFDGSDSLTLASNTNLALGSGDFEVSFWLYPTTTTQRNMIWSANGSPAIFMNSSRQLQFDNYGVASIATSTNTMDLNAWNHCVASRVSGTLKLFINGAEGASVSNSTNWGSATLNLGFDSGVTYMTGYMSGIRVVKGSGVTSVTVPTAPPTAITNTQLLLNFTNAGITDATAKNDLETVGNAQISTTQSKFGGSSMYFDGTGDWLIVPNNAFYNFGSGDFTIEFWWYPNTTADQNLISKWNSATEWILQWRNAGNFRWAANGSVVRDATYTLSTGAWIHVAVSCASGSLRIFVNGTQIGTTATQSSITTTTEPVVIGAGQLSTTPAPVNGYFDDVRITRFARYTSNFTAPTAAFPVQ